MTKNLRRLFRSFWHMVLSFLLIIFFLFILKKVIDVFINRISNESVLIEVLRIDFSELTSLAIFLIFLFFSLFLIVASVIWTVGKLFNLPKKEIERAILFFEKLTIALFPTLLLAGSLDVQSFTTVTSMISFFAIFTFVFKSRIWEKESSNDSDE